MQMPSITSSTADESSSQQLTICPLFCGSWAASPSFSGVITLFSSNKVELKERATEALGTAAAGGRRGRVHFAAYHPRRDAVGWTVAASDNFAASLN